MKHRRVILQEAFVDEALSQLEGDSLGYMLDFLSKELIRLQVSGAWKEWESGWETEFRAFGPKHD